MKRKEDFGKNLFAECMGQLWKADWLLKQN